MWDNVLVQNVTPNSEPIRIFHSWGQDFICRPILIVWGGCMLQLELLYHEIITTPADGLFLLMYIQMRENVFSCVRKIAKSYY
jgi:hypothetical protein